MAVSTPVPSRRLPLRQNVALLPHTSMRVGGPAAKAIDIHDAHDELLALIAHAEREGQALYILGEGSNVVVADEGIDGIVAWLRPRNIRYRTTPTGVLVHADAGADFPSLCAETVASGLMGLAALSGIPGSVGAAPIQNIGAYGQALSDVLVAVHVLDRVHRTPRRLEAKDLGLGYRTSHFKVAWQDRFIITAIELCLPLGASVPPQHGQLLAALGKTRAHAPPSEVARAVLALRRDKGMLWRPDAPSSPPHHAGSFFTNPLVTKADAERLRARMPHLPQWPEQKGVKLSAAYLIEAAGFERGWRDRRFMGRVGLSERHALALANFGGAKASELLAAARRIQEAVYAAAGVHLELEPRLLGFAAARL